MIYCKWYCPSSENWQVKWFSSKIHFIWLLYLVWLPQLKTWSKYWKYHPRAIIASWFCCFVTYMEWRKMKYLQTVNNGPSVNDEVFAMPRVYMFRNRLKWYECSSTGAHIETNKPVAAFSGNVKTNVGNGTFQDHLVEQLVPSDRWGQKFVTAPIPGRTVGDVFKVIAREDNTVINVPGQAPIHLNKGGVARFELTSDKYNYITSTKPIMLAQFVKSQQKPTEPADPSMMIIPPYEQFGSDYTFTTPEYSHPEYGTDPTFRYKNEFMIVTKKSDIQGLLLDGKPFPKTTWTDIPGTDLVGSYVTLPHGPHTVRHSNPLSTFGGYLYGHAYHESYGFPTGMRTAIIYSAVSYSTWI